MAENLNEIVIVASQTPGMATFNNYEELKALLQNIHDTYMSIDYSCSSLRTMEADLKALRRAKKILNDAKKELEEGYTAPFEVVKAQLNELIDLIKEPEKRINDCIKEIERADKQLEIKVYAQQCAKVLGEHAERVINSPAFFNERWLNKSYTPKQWRQDVQDIVDRAVNDIDNILSAGGSAKQPLLARYYETLSNKGAEEFLEALNTKVDGIEPTETETPDEGPIGYKVLKIYGIERQMLKLMGELDLASFDYEELEDGMPKSMVEITDPDFSDYVCFDIETTGTFGIARGDTEAEITEIGAVKVVNGQVVEKFDMLANPGRKIVPRIARLTHITDEMVATEPPIDEVIARFADFCCGYKLVGHNVKSCDIPHISRAAKRAGVAMENEFFDTYQYAKKFKDDYAWDNLKLEYLSEQFGLPHEDAHRAWCDAEANVGVFEELKKIGV